MNKKGIFFPKNYITALTKEPTSKVFGSYMITYMYRFDRNKTGETCLIININFIKFITSTEIEG